MAQEQGNKDFGNGEHGGNRNFTPPVRGYIDGHGDVTASFGRNGHEGETLLSDSHNKSKAQFDGHRGDGGRRRGHDHYYPDGRESGARGNYSGPGGGISGGPDHGNMS